MRVKELAYWINERESMRIKKEEGDCCPPFSLDPAMANVRYCNIHREDDKVTRWIASNWRDANFESPDITLAMVTARMINWPETLDAVGYPHCGDEYMFRDWAARAKDRIRDRQFVQQKVWTSAYTISTCGRAMPKESYVFDHVLAQVAKMDWVYVNDPPEWHCTLAGAHKALMTVDGLGSFLAAQVVADLKNTKGHPLATAPDWWTWSAPGPGSLRGLKAFFEHSVSEKYYQPHIEQCYDEVKDHLYPYVGPLHMQDFQNCLCEFSKYMRVKEGDGRVRNKYSPR